MPSISQTDIESTASFEPVAGTLYIVATPIGHLRDITLRALDVLKGVNLIAAEDTRHTKQLLTHYGIKTRLISYHDHNEKERTPFLVEQLRSGETVALVSDAGTPTISDPGYVLIQAAINAGFPVTVIPGVSSVTAALSISGLSSNEYLFVGFIGKKERHRLTDLAVEQRTIIFFESPKRILTFIRSLLPIFGDRHGVLCRELTKYHEEVIRGPLSHIEETLSSRSEIKGECVLLVSGSEKEKEMPMEDLRKVLTQRLSDPTVSLSEAVKEITQTYGLPKRQVYEEALRIKNQSDESD
jgi:16S rRNA (cytidine1402-2'-O)-methyltransferase